MLFIYSFIIILFFNFVFLRIKARLFKIIVCRLLFVDFQQYYNITKIIQM